MLLTTVSSTSKPTTMFLGTGVCALTTIPCGLTVRKAPFRYIVPSSTSNFVVRPTVSNSTLPVSSNDELAISRLAPALTIATRFAPVPVVVEIETLTTSMY